MREFPSCTPIQTGDSFNLGDHTRYRFVVVDGIQIAEEGEQSWHGFYGLS